MRKDSRLQRPLWEKRIAKARWYVDSDIIPTQAEYDKIAAWLNDRQGGWTPKVWGWREEIYDCVVILNRRRVAQNRPLPT